MRSTFRPALCVGLALLAGGARAETANRLPASVGGAALPTGIRHEIVVEQDLDQPDMARITLAGPRGHTFADERELGDDVKVEGVFSGEVVSIEPLFESHDDRVVIRALNRLHRLTGERKTRDFFDLTDAEIAAIIAREHGLAAQAPSGVPPRHEHVYQHNQTDLEFLLERAALIGFAVWCEDTTLFFDRKEDLPPIVLGPRHADGDARLLRFHPRLSSTDTVQKVVVRGWDPEGRAMVGEAAAPTIRLTPGEPDPGLVFGRTVDLTVDEPIFSAEEASAIAKAKLEDLTLTYVTGEAEAAGNPKIKPGVLVTIAGSDLLFDGRYYVRGVSHRYAHGEGCDGGYRSRLRVRRQPIALFYIPAIDDEVLVAFEHGDHNRPFVVGSLWEDDDDCSGDRPPRP